MEKLQLGNLVWESCFPHFQGVILEMTLSQESWKSYREPSQTCGFHKSELEVGRWLQSSVGSAGEVFLNKIWNYWKTFDLLLSALKLQLTTSSNCTSPAVHNLHNWVSALSYIPKYKIGLQLSALQMQFLRKRELFILKCNFNQLLHWLYSAYGF